MIGERTGGRTVHRAFAAVAAAQPERTALVHGNDRLSYRTLAGWMERLGAELAPVIEAEEPVGLCATRSPGAIAAMLGILRAGGAYVPLDPGQPDARLAMLVQDSGVRRLFVAGEQLARLRRLLPEHVQLLPLDSAPPQPVPAADEYGSGDGDRLAYLMYTSGSTGKPKAVMVEHRSVLALARTPFAAVIAEDVFLQLAPLHVDPSVFEIWGALLNGATLVLPAAGELSVHDIGRAVVRHRASVLRLAAPVFKLVVENDSSALRGLRLLICGGDRADVGAVRRALAELPGCVVVNGYGPTETTVYACWHRMTGIQEVRRTVPIGRPLPGSWTLVLDADQVPVGAGEVGELCVGGVGVARGYWRRPGLTAGRFIAHPAHPGERAYLTGDRVRRLPDGSLEFVGRIDDQLKIRGYRVELGEVERALLDQPDVREGVVVRSARGGPTVLAAFAALAPGARATGAQLRARLAARLPQYMVPTAVRILPELPRTPNGKTDRRGLAELGVGPAETGGEPSERYGQVSEVERALLAIWREVLVVAALGPETSFFDLGGDSLSALAITARIERELGAALSPVALFETPTVRALAAAIEAADRPATAAAPRAGERVPLLPSQQGIWFEEQLAGDGRYSISRTFRVSGALNQTALVTSLRQLAHRHRVLTSVIESDQAGNWWQRSRSEAELPIRQVDLSTLPAGIREDRARELIAESVATDVRTTGGPLARALVIGLGDARWLLHLDVHHVIADDRSIDLLTAELGERYEANRTAPDAAVPPPADQSYADHVAAEWERHDRRSAEALESWRRTLAGWSGSLDLWTDHQRPAVLSGAGDLVRVELGAELTERISTEARERQVTPYMVCLAAVYLVLSRYAEQDDLCLGTLLTRRRGPAEDALVGYFLSPQALRLTADGESTAGELLHRVRTACADAFRFPEVPFQSIARELGLPPSALQAVVNYQQRPARPLRLRGTEVEPWQRPHRFAKFELCFSFLAAAEPAAGTAVEIEFSADLFRRDVVRALADHLVTALSWVVSDPAARLRDLDLGGSEERRPAGEASVDLEDAEVTLHQLVSRQATAHPDKVAAVGEGLTLTYRELTEASDQVAARLRRHGVARGDRVAICLSRSPQLITAVLGVLKAGAAYVPLDPSYPAERLAFVVEDARAAALVSTKELLSELFDGPATGGPPTLDIDELLAPAERVPELPGPPAAGGADLAYVIYTSGSTGRPRGVMVEHRSVVNTLRASLRRHPVGESDVWLQLTSPGFDVAAYEQFMPLVSGGTVVYCPDDTRQDGHALTELVRERGITVLVAVPSLLRALGRPELAGVRVLVVAGEPADAADMRYYARNRVVINGYGPTEAAILATTYEVGEADAWARVPIGTPLDGSSAHVLDRFGRPAAANVPGELYLGGAGVGRGYWRNAEQTELRFGPVPGFGTQRLYRTGDRVRRLPDGNLDFLGRLDDQVKLRGFRVELGEVEAALTEHPQVGEAAVVVHGAGPEATLVAFLAGTADTEQVRDHLIRKLPRYMVPARFLRLPRLPVTSHGKADRKELHRLAARAVVRPTADPADRAGSARLTEQERRVDALWQEVLGSAPSSPDQDFFELGGHSLGIVRLLALVELRIGVRIGVRDFLTAPTVRALARRIDLARSGAAVPAEEMVDRHEVRLDPGLSFGRPRPQPSGAVLLTGATGFVGSFLLRELLDRTGSEVRCLVRAASPPEARRRLAAVIARYRLPIDPRDPRIVPVPGNLAEPELGLDRRGWAELVEQVGTVVHAGAQVHHLSGYRRLAPTNLQGTETLLRLAATGPGKRFHHLSTMAVFGTGPQARVIDEATAVEQERHPAGRGYSASKWTAELLVGEAIDRGADARIYRLGRAAGAADSGVANLDDMFCRLLISSAWLGCYPADIELAFNLMPVDVMARALTALALAEDDAAAVHHLHHVRDTGLGPFLAGYDRRTGRHTRPVPMADWVRRLRAAPQLPGYAYLDQLREKAEAVLPAAGGDRWANDRSVTRLAELGVMLPEFGPELIDRHWEYLDRSTDPLSDLP